MDKEKYGHVLALISVAVWGTTFIATKLLLEYFEPIEILFYRFVVGYVMLWILHPHTMKTVKLSDELLCLVAGAGGVSIYFLFENYALTYTYASNVSIIVATAPFLTGLLARIVYKERLKRGFMLGFVLSIAGIILITLNGSMELHLNPFGDLLAIGASLCWAFYSIATVEVKRPEYSSIALTRRIFFYGLITMLPLMPLTGFRFDPESLMMPRNIGLYLYLGVMASGLCYITWNKAMEILGAVRTTVYIYLVPVVTLIFSYFVLGERLTAVSLFGCAVILAGLIMSERK